MSNIESKDPAEIVTDIEMVASDTAFDAKHTHKVHWYRSTMFQAFVTGAASFMGVGLFNALSATGAGGLQNTYTANSSMALGWGPMIPIAWMASGIISKLGPKWALFYGTLGYIFYAAALYTNSAYGNQWFVMFGAFLSAMTSGVFFPVEGAIITIYPEPWYKGRALALWQSMYRAAPLIGGAINMSFNYQNVKTGGLAPKTYLVFVGLMVLAPLSTLLLSPPEKVQRTDGSPVPSFPKDSMWTEFVETMKTLKDPKIISLSVLWAQPLFAPALLGTFLAKHFSVRVRALSSLVLPVVEIILFQVIGYVVDKTNIPVRKRMTWVWIPLNVLSLGSMIWMFVNIVVMDKYYPTRAYDWTSPGFAQIWTCLILATALPYVACGFYYVLAGYSFPINSSGIRLTRVMSQLRAAEAGGAAVAYGMLAGGASFIVAGACNLALLVICIVVGCHLLLEVRKQDLDGKFTRDTMAASQLVGLESVEEEK